MKPTPIDPHEMYQTATSEDVVLAGMLSSPARLAAAISGGLRVEDFAPGDNQTLAGLLFDQFRQWGRASAESVRAELAETKRLTVALGQRILALAYETAPETLATFDDHLGRMAAAARLRAFDAAFWALHSDVFASDGKSLRERVRTYEAGLEKLLELSGGSVQAVYRADDLARLAEAPDRYVPTGVAQLDAAIRGYVPGRVVVVAARPSHGKTAFSIELSVRMSRRLEAAGEAGQVLYFTAEMSAEMFAKRLRSRGEDIRRLRLTVDDTARPTSVYMLGRATALHAVTPVRLVVFDYLQYTGDVADSRRLSLDAALMGCHEMAKRLDCPVLVLAQLNRDIEKRSTSSDLADPQLSDLKETGGAEEIAGLVLMLHHPWTHWFQRGQSVEDEPDREKFSVFVRKNTHGPLGWATLRFERETGRFTDPTEEDAAPGRLVARSGAQPAARSEARPAAVLTPEMEIPF